MQPCLNDSKRMASDGEPTDRSPGGERGSLFLLVRCVGCALAYHIHGDRQTRMLSVPSVGVIKGRWQQAQ